MDKLLLLAAGAGLVYLYINRTPAPVVILPANTGNNNIALPAAAANTGVPANITNAISVISNALSSSGYDAATVAKVTTNNPALITALSKLPSTGTSVPGGVWIPKKIGSHVSSISGL